MSIQAIRRDTTEMACERHEQITDLARTRLDLDHTLDRVAAYVHLWEAGLRQVLKQAVAAALLPLPFGTAAPSKLHVYRRGGERKLAGDSPARLERGDGGGGEKGIRYSDDQSVDGSGGSTAVSQVDGSWTYINSRGTDMSSFVWLPSQTSSVADVRVKASDGFSSPVTASFSAEALSSSASSSTDVQYIGSWLADMCAAVDAQSLLLPQTLDEAASSTEMDVELESDLETFMHTGGMRLGGLNGDRRWVSGCWKIDPEWDDVRHTAEVGGSQLTGGCLLLGRDGAPWSHLAVVGA